MNEVCPVRCDPLWVNDTGCNEFILRCLERYVYLDKTQWSKPSWWVAVLLVQSSDCGKPPTEIRNTVKRVHNIILFIFTWVHMCCKLYQLFLPKMIVVYFFQPTSEQPMYQWYACKCTILILLGTKLFKQEYFFIVGGYPVWYLIFYVFCFFNHT